jgi:hypothetical protein
LKAVRKKKTNNIQITADFSKETLKGIRVWSEVFQALNENNFNPRITLPSKTIIQNRWSNKSLP